MYGIGQFRNNEKYIENSNDSNLLFNAATPILAQSLCGSDKFLCNNQTGECIPVEKVYDTIVDCQNGADESNEGRIWVAGTLFRDGTGSLDSLDLHTKIKISSVVSSHHRLFYDIGTFQETGCVMIIKPHLL